MINVKENGLLSGFQTVRLLPIQPASTRASASYQLSHIGTVADFLIDCVPEEDRNCSKTGRQYWRPVNLQPLPRVLQELITQNRFTLLNLRLRTSQSPQRNKPVLRDHRLLLQNDFPIKSRHARIVSRIILLRTPPIFLS